MKRTFAFPPGSDPKPVKAKKTEGQKKLERDMKALVKASKKSPYVPVEDDFPAHVRGRKPVDKEGYVIEEEPRRRYVEQVNASYEERLNRLATQVKDLSDEMTQIKNIVRGIVEILSVMGTASRSAMLYTLRKQLKELLK